MALRHDGALMAGPRIFICYRREGTGDSAHRLHDALVKAFGEDDVFIDLDIPGGAGVRRHITEKLQACVVLLVVIGPDWLTATDGSGQRRLDDESDYVRVEIATALESDKVIVPLRVKDAKMPSASELPAELARIAEYNSPQLADGVYWHDDIRRLTATIAQHLQSTEPPPPPAPPGPWWLRAPAATWRWVRGHPVSLVIVALVAVAIVILRSGGSEEPLRIYSSLPATAQPTSSNAGARGPRNQRTTDMQNAMKLAIDLAGHKAGPWDVEYVPLDDSDASGETPTTQVQANARRAASDPRAAVYIGEYNSGATQDSIPILSAAQIAQISPSATRVGLTQSDSIGDNDEPDRYHIGGVKNFVRLIPTAAVIAKSLLTRMAADRCATAAMINDATPYGADLAGNILDYKPAYAKHTRLVFSQSVDANGRYAYLLKRLRKHNPSCFVYVGTRHANTVQIFRDFANVLRSPAKLYGTNGVADASFYQGLQPIAERVAVMLPWYAKNQEPAKTFIARFQHDYHRYPDPYAFYAYEAMSLALDAIKNSHTGKHDDVLTALFNESRPDTVLGSYALTPSGDITPARAGIGDVADGRSAAPALAPCRDCR